MLRFRSAAALSLALLTLGCGALPWGGAAPDDASADWDGAVPMDTPRVPPVLADTGFGRDVAQAVLTHPALGGGNARIRAAEAELEAEQGAFRPQISVGTDSRIRFSGDRSVRSTPLVQVEQLLFDGGEVRSRSAAAEARIAGSRSDRIGTASGLALNAVEAALTLAHERRLLALADRDLAVHSEFLGQTDERVQAGVGTEADLLSARSRLADATARRAAAQGRLARAEAAYLEAFGHVPHGVETAPAAPSLPAVDDATLIRLSPRMQSIEAEVAAARASLRAVEASRLPRLSVLLNGARESGGGADVSADLRLRYDLGTGGQRRASVNAATFRLQEVESQRLSLERQIVRALQDVRADQVSGNARLVAARAALEANRAAVEAAREQFAVGRRSIGQLLDSQRDFVQASETLARAELDLALAGYAALALTGDILHVFGVELPPVSPEDDE
jgi:adhesin transport system outer membrane protein